MWRFTYSLTSFCDFSDLWHSNESAESSNVDKGDPCPNDVTKSGGGKNANHANQKRRDVAAKKYETAKSEYESLKSQPNKTKDVKKAMEKARKDKDFTGEHHSSNAKGNR